jgi:segregation and condensation protein B
MDNNLEKKIEAVLFYLAEPVSLNSLAKSLEVSNSEIKKALDSLKEKLADRGLTLVFHENEVTLVTSPEFSETIEKIVKEERERDLGRAGIETLSIIAYKGPVSKRDIEYIRGVNSQFVLRNLLLRGLVERKNSREDERVILYNITLDTLRYLGIKSINELPEYEGVRAQLDVREEDLEQNQE